MLRAKFSSKKPVSRLFFSSYVLCLSFIPRRIYNNFIYRNTLWLCHTLSEVELLMYSKDKLFKWNTSFDLSQLQKNIESFFLRSCYNEFLLTFKDEKKSFKISQILQKRKAFFIALLSLPWHFVYETIFLYALAWQVMKMWISRDTVRKIE